MAEDLLPLLGHNIDGEEDDSSDSDSQDVEDDTDRDEGPARQENSESRREPAPCINFERSLPGEHSYLGSDLEEVRGRTVHDDDSYLSLPIMSLPGVVLVPGQTLPLHIFQPNMVAMIRHIMERDKTFGLVTSRYLGNDFSPSLANIGTTAEIFSIKEENDERTGIVSVRVKATGRQRFHIAETRRQADGIVVAQIRILPERILGQPLEGVVPDSHQRHLRCLMAETQSPFSVTTGDHRDVIKQWLTANKKRKIDRFTSANFTWWPPWVYKQYDVELLVQKVKSELQSWNETLAAERMPGDPVEFSYWVAGNLPIDDGLKLYLLRIDSAIQRLRCELGIMQRCTVLCCRECNRLITNKNDVFSMASGGPMAAYVNPGGYVHETLTVYKAQGLILRGRPSTENSWFPGYAWTIVECNSCGSHMGWKFTADKKKLQPDKFWGLTRSALLPGLANDDEQADSSEWQPTV